MTRSEETSQDDSAPADAEDEPAVADAPPAAGAAATIALLEQQADARAAEAEATERPEPVQDAADPADVTAAEPDPASTGGLTALLAAPSAAWVLDDADTGDGADPIIGTVADFDPDADMLVIDATLAEGSDYTLSAIETVAAEDGIDLVLTADNTDDPDAPPLTKVLRVDGIAALDPEAIITIEGAEPVILPGTEDAA